MIDAAAHHLMALSEFESTHFFAGLRSLHQISGSSYAMYVGSGEGMYV